MPFEHLSLRIRDKEVAVILGCGKSTVWNWVKTRPGFPQPRKEGNRCTFWLRHEVEAYALHGADWQEGVADAR